MNTNTMNTNDASPTREQIEEMNKLADAALADEKLMERAVDAAVAAGTLLNCTEDLEALSSWWVALSRAVHEDAVAWGEGSDRWRDVHEQLRMQHLDSMLLHAVRAHHSEGDVVRFRVLRIPRGGDTPEVRELTMRVRGSWLIVTLPGDADPLGT